jgi:hypothetical protein
MTDQSVVAPAEDCVNLAGLNTLERRQELRSVGPLAGWIDDDTFLGILRGAVVLAVHMLGHNLPALFFAEAVHF